MKEKIVVPLSVIKGLIEVRDSGKYNMFEAQSVFYELFQLGYHEAVSWLLDPRKVDRSYGSQVDNEKYMAALKDMGECLGLANYMANQ